MMKNPARQSASNFDASPVSCHVPTGGRLGAASDVVRRLLLARLAIIAAAVMIIDQGTKLIVRRSLELCPPGHLFGCERVLLPGPAGLVRKQNSGGAFGLSQDLWVWVPIAVLGLALVLFYARGGRLTLGMAIGAGLQVGGALGNLADRVAFGAVTDFIYYANSFVFNLADVSLAIGTLIVTWSLATSSTELWESSPPAHWLW